MTSIQQGRRKVEMPEGVFGFGIAEVAYLVSRSASDSSAIATSLFAIEELLADERFLEAGVSSLIARGLVTRDGDDAVTLAEATLLEVAAADSDLWLVATLASGDDSDLAVLALSPALIGILQPRAVGSWFASFAPGEGTQPGAVALGIVETFINAHPGGVGAIALAGADATPLAGLRREVDGSWSVAVDEVAQPCSRAEAVEQLDRLIAAARGV